MTMLSTREAARRLELSARHGLADEARDHREDIRRALIDLVHALNALKEAGVDVGDAANTLDVEIAKRDAALCKTIDEAGHYCESLDVSELRDLA